MPEIEESLLKKKLESYSSEQNDFQAENELTVKITLNEYRNLIKEHALSDHKIKEAEKNKYTRESENKKLKEENKELSMKLEIYKAKYGELEASKNKEADEENEQSNFNG